jgi:predicted LPLAT superfamily acyltransferase
MSEDNRWKGKTGGGEFGQRFLLFIFKYVKVTVIYPVLVLVIPFYFLFGRKGRKAIYFYFHSILGYSPAKAFFATFKNHYIFGKIVLDKFALAAGRADQFKIDVDLLDLFNEMSEAPEGCVVAGSHVGNFELCGHAMKQDKKAINSIVYDGESIDLQRSRQKSLDSYNVHLVPIKEDMSHIFAVKSALERGEFVTVVCDRISGSNKFLNIDFMGKPAKFPLGPFVLAASSNVKMISIFIIKQKGLHYKSFVFPLDGDKDGTVMDNAKALATSYVRSLETILWHFPHQWFNYYQFWDIAN